ncbi:DUF4168 domain-containing protein [Phormidium sp. CCY1219]|uniref:DUF4168 domain-containing protein n=1 Tax=Phormidium sp. CCY1219 TaxID=2886104 RepID=UPI002D1E61D2|nr:DUF4168 domain-containing protein [Phormidium sp. CCY1219]MEB3826921.1 DUF4168 domain-containing protein [Phormidium sp. CCY1219]
MKKLTICLARSLRFPFPQLALLRSMAIALGLWVAAAMMLGGAAVSLADSPRDLPTLTAPLEQAPQARPPLDASTIPSEKVSQFVRAYLQVLTLIDERSEELLNAETTEDSHRLEGEIEAEALCFIKDAGLTQQEYLQMLSLANIDPEFGERIAAGLEEAKK